MQNFWKRRVAGVPADGALNALGQAQGVVAHQATTASRPTERFRLVRYFSLASFTAFLLFAAALLYFEHLENDFFKQVQQEQNRFFARLQDSFVQRHDPGASAYLLRVYEAGNINLARLFSNAMWDKKFTPLVAKAQRIPVDQCRSIAEVKDSGGKTVQPGEKQACYAGIGRKIVALPEFRGIDAWVFEMMKKSTVLKIKVYDLRGITLYSSEHKQIGEDKTGDAGWVSAVAGKPASALTRRDRFSAFEGVVVNRDLISTYLPVRAAGSENIVGVFEVYSDVTPFLEQINSTSSEIRKLIAANRTQVDVAAAANREKVDANQKVLLAAMFGTLVLLYLALYLIVRNAQRIIDKQDLERRRVGLALARQKDLYDALSQTNKAIVHLPSREELFESVCRIAVEHGRFRFAWVGLIDKDDQRLRPVAQYGEDAGYMNQLDIAGDTAGASGRGLTGRTLLSGTYVVSNDFLDDPATAQWREAGRRAGVRASAKFPIRQDGAVVGAISFYAGETEFFTGDLIATLEEMALDVSFALDNFRREAERKHAIGTLRESEARFRSLFGNMLNGFAYCRMQYDDRDRPVDFVYLDVNKSFERLTGLKNVAGKNVTEVIPGIKEGSPELFEIYGRVASSGNPETFEIDLKPLRQWFSVSVYSPERGYFVAVFDVITERKKADEALRQSEGKLRAIFDGVLDGILVADAKAGTFLTGNPAICRMLGYTPEEILRLGVADIHSQQDLPRAKEQFGRLVRGEIQIAADIPVMRKDGSVFFADIKATPIRLGDKDGLLGVFRDVTERKQSERALRAAEEQFRGLVEQSIAGTYIIQDGKVVYVNPRCAEILGQGSTDELIGSDPLLLIAEADRGKVAENMRRLLEGEAQSVELDFGDQRRDGVAIQVGVNGARATHEGRPAIIGLLQDISEKKRAEEEIRRYIEQLKTAFMSTVDVATTISEMRDPYTAGHERRVAEIAVAIAAELGFEPRRLEGMRVAGCLHDLGKITVPTEILAKPGKLTPVELALIKQHAQASFDILKDVEFPWPVAQIALQHHERMDGSGYPQGLKGKAILIEARIMAVADVVEAMASHRPYRPALGIEKALAEIERGHGTAYDPVVADACLKLFREQGYAIPA